MDTSPILTDSMPFFTEQGQGETVLCLHSNASTSSQWRALASQLCDRFHVVAADGYGAGKSPDWPAALPASFDAEMALLAPLLTRTDGPVHLVGHSYGAAVALQIGLRFPRRVRSVVAYEPTLFYLLAGTDPSRSPVAGIWHAASDAAAAVDRGDPKAAARRFIDFWTGDGTWDGMPEKRQEAVAHAVRHAGRWLQATLTGTAPAEAFAALDIPVLLMSGDRSPESARSVVHWLAGALPRASFVDEPGLGHMGPITHADRVNARIVSFLDTQRSLA